MAKSPVLVEKKGQPGVFTQIGAADSKPKAREVWMMHGHRPCGGDFTTAYDPGRKAFVITYPPAEGAHG